MKQNRIKLIQPTKIDYTLFAKNVISSIHTRIFRTYVVVDKNGVEKFSRQMNRVTAERFAKENDFELVEA